MAVTSPKAEPGGMRDVIRRTVRAEIAAKAMGLFLEHGFEETTLNQVAAAVGMSSRNVSRYFDSKEEMAIGELVELGHEVAAALDGRPGDEDPWIALRHALQVCVDSLEGQEVGRRRATMLANTPSLRTAMLDKQMRWQEILVPHVERRLHVTGDLGTLQARALVSTALACLDVAATAWTQPPSDRSLRDLVDAAFAAIRS